ncbi:hypothetical protein A2482_00070 [Candidatus Falkowbacteria bacterium RIFOXYC2_FULL_48_21]|uniref:Uncharacterized protein n=1 Tax=Candidatus Falkowbacteria bacterium RIFOXYC2_FULL_48_21 TaxID=1798005 RepID=A0A1F5T801_9BACT|nr:MAG: hypothetical protein A2482_00070 [Candidatus Falkowbacteria bacterium RIFOXYC2_FULL_48_21]
MNSEKKKPYAEVVRERMEKAQEEKHLAQAARTKRESAAYWSAYEEEKVRLENGGMQALFEKEWKPQIDEAAGRSENEITIVLQRNSGRNDVFFTENKVRYEVGVVFLSREGFITELHLRFLEGTGGDDPYPDETFIGIKVRW